MFNQLTYEKELRKGEQSEEKGNEMGKKSVEEVWRAVEQQSVSLFMWKLFVSHEWPPLFYNSFMKWNLGISPLLSVNTTHTNCSFLSFVHRYTNYQKELNQALQFSSNEKEGNAHQRENVWLPDFDRIRLACYSYFLDSTERHLSWKYSINSLLENLVWEFATFCLVRQSKKSLSYVKLW